MKLTHVLSRALENKKVDCWKKLKGRCRFWDLTSLTRSPAWADARKQGTGNGDQLPIFNNAKLELLTYSSLVSAFNLQYLYTSPAHFRRSTRINHLRRYSVNISSKFKQTMERLRGKTLTSWFSHSWRIRSFTFRHKSFTRSQGTEVSNDSLTTS